MRHHEPLHEPASVTLRVKRPDAERVAIVGEMFDWLTPRALAKVEGGDFERRLALPAGVYAYKLKIDGQWSLHPENPRTWTRGGDENSVLTLGGTNEPVLFAPAPPFVHEEERGGVVVVAGLRRGAGDALALRWREGGDGEARAHRSAMTRVTEDDSHVFFRARLPISSSRATYVFELADGSHVGAGGDQAFTYESTRASGVPAWWRDAVVYAIFVDRFRPEHDGDLAAWHVDPGPNRAAGGHLEGIRRSLDELADLGVNTLYLTPVHVAASCHRYDVVDPLSVDPALGGEAAFERLVDDAHARGMKVLLDFSFSHAGRGFAPYEDVLVHGRSSRYASWFQWTDAGELRCYGKRSDAPLFDLDLPEVRALALLAAETWARRGIDGFRLDAAAEVPFELARAIRAKLLEIRPDAIVLGEVVPAHAWRWRAEGAVDAATDFEFHALCTDFLARRSIDAPEAQRRLEGIDMRRGASASAALRFLSTHDHARFATLAGVEGGAARVPLGLFFLLTSPGVPALFYGDELGMCADQAALEPETAWKDRAPMPWRDRAEDVPLRALVKRLLAVRAGSAALRIGDHEVVAAEGATLVSRRTAEGDVVDVVVHAGDDTVEIVLEDDELPLLEPLVTVGDVSLDGQVIRLGPHSAIAARRKRERYARRRTLALIENPAVRDREFAANVETVGSRPTRIDFALTERCNLRCQHCITDAPEKTRTRTARTLSPWLLDRVREHLAFAHYFGFVHGGESLTTPVLFDVLDAIRAERGPLPYVAHLLTNGALLHGETCERLLEKNVRSISVSLDGATAATNDAVRLGGRFEQIVENVEDLLRRRRAREADLRVGISFVVLQSNIGELAEIVRLAARLGVDWVKLEEAVAVNAFSARSLVRCGDARVRDAVRAAMDLGERLGLVVVDHTAPPPVWRCKLDGDAARFLAADEFANRSEIHPCRAPWEHACIEPNGDVKMGDFFGAVLGNLAESPLDLVWNGPVARSERVRSQTTRLCGSGPVTCVAMADRGAPPRRDHA